MDEQLIIRDFNDKHTRGYLALTQCLGQIRTLCLPETRPKNIAIELIFLKIHGLIDEIERAFIQFKHVFSSSEKDDIQAYIAKMKTMIERQPGDPQDISTVMLKDIYECSTELRVALGIFTVTVPAILS